MHNHSVATDGYEQNMFCKNSYKISQIKNCWTFEGDIFFDLVSMLQFLFQYHALH